MVHAGYYSFNSTWTYDCFVTIEGSLDFVYGVFLFNLYHLVCDLRIFLILIVSGWLVDALTGSSRHTDTDTDTDRRQTVTWSVQRGALACRLAAK